MVNELSIEQLYRTCDPSTLECDSSEDAQDLETIIGQDRAVRAMRFGLGIKERGFNIYVAGHPGTGRTTAIERYLYEFASDQAVPSDWCYVNNFNDPLEPQALRLPAGKAASIKRDIERTVETAVDDLRAAFKSDEYESHRNDLVNNIQDQKQELFNQIGQRAQEEGFVLQPTPMGLLTVPTRAGRPITEEEFLLLSEGERKDIKEKQQHLKDTLEEATLSAKNLDRQLREQVEKLDQEVASYAISLHFDELSKKYQDLEEIHAHIEFVRQDILQNVKELIADGSEQLPPPFGAGKSQRSLLKKYAINVLVDNANLEGAPVVIEMHPTVANLVGRTEHEALMGALVTDFTLIRVGCLHRANGGYLVLPVEDLLRTPFAWDTLKRALANRQIVIEDVVERMGFSTKSLRPEPIPLDVKVILVGVPSLYQLLLQFDEQFNELFKVKADFDNRMPRSQERIQEYICFVSALCKGENLQHLDRSALARIVEHGSRLADDQEKLSTHFGEMADVIREASYYARQEGAPLVQANHVGKAIEERFYRSSMIHDAIQEMISRDQIKISVQGGEVGQVNGLSVFILGDISFGKPSRITASTSLGRDGVIDIEREAELSGPIHTKGVLILSSYLAEKYAQDKPLSLSARLVFEQSYSGVEGDSASSTELYALLSALSGLPVKQGIAVTGSINQKGEVQVIGGVNEKIEGFFEVCLAKGLTGDQGVIIPAGNTTNLMLREPVLEAVREGKFHIWAVDSMDEGIEILTGVKAGERLEDGSFEPDSLNARVDARLQEMADSLAKFGKEANSEN